MTSDDQLLSRYARDGDEAAFAELVRRYVDLVYSASLRLTFGDAAMAQDVSQSVFTDLARKAWKLSGRGTISGWLHTSVRFAAAKARRGEMRRRTHEQEAFAMQEQPTAPEIQWEQLRPALDEAVGQLREGDRDAVVLRYFQNKSHREIGETLGLNEEAARKRVDRAMEKLRMHFAQRGVTVTSALLATTITANSVQAAPVEYTEQFTKASLAKAGGVAANGLLINLLFMTTRIKLFIAMAAVAAIGLLFIFNWNWGPEASPVDAPVHAPAQAKAPDAAILPHGPAAAKSGPGSTITSAAASASVQNADRQLGTMRLPGDPANGISVVRAALEEWQATPGRLPLGDLNKLTIIPLLPRYMLQGADLVNGDGLKAAKLESFLYTVNEQANASSGAAISAIVHLDNPAHAADAVLTIVVFNFQFNQFLELMQNDEQVKKGFYELRFLQVNDTYGRRLGVAFWLKSTTSGVDLIFPRNEVSPTLIKNRQIYTADEYLGLERQALSQRKPPVGARFQ